MHNHAALLLEIVVHPQVVVARKEVYFNTVVREFGNLSQQPCVAFRHDVAVLVPEVEDVAEQVYRGSFVLDAVEEVYEPSFLHASVRYGEAAEVCVGDEVYRFHYYSIIFRILGN